MKVKMRVHSLSISEVLPDCGLHMRPVATVKLEPVNKPPVARSENLHEGIVLTVTDPLLIGFFHHGRQYEIDFTKVEE